MRFTSAIPSSSLVKDLVCSSICEISISFFANERLRWYHNPLHSRPYPPALPSPASGEGRAGKGRVREEGKRKIAIDYCSQRVLISGMSIERSALPLGDDRAR